MRFSCPFQLGGIHRPIGEEKSLMDRLSGGKVELGQVE